MSVQLCFTQVEGNIQAFSGGKFQIESFWNIELQNFSGAEQWIALYGKLQSANGQETFIEAQSQVFVLQDGFFRPALGQIVTQSSHIYQGDLPAGEYLLCVYVQDERNQVRLWQHCQLISFTKDQQIGQSNRNSPFSWSGFSRIEGQWSNQQRLFQQRPASYLRGQFFPQFQLYGVPFGAYAYMTTEHQSSQYQLNHLQFSFDAQQLQQLLQQKAKAKLAEAELAQQLGKVRPDDFLHQVQILNDEAYTQALGKLKEKYKLNSSISVEEYIEQMATLERIEQSLALPMFENLNQGKASWEKIYNEGDQQAIGALKDSLNQTNIGEYEAFLRWESLRQQKAQLEAKKKKLKQLQQSSSSLSELEKEWKVLQKDRQNQFKQILSQPDQLKRLDLANKSQRILSNFQQIGIGNVFPLLDPLTVNGVQVQGLDVSMTNKRIFSQVVAGRMRRPFPLQDSSVSGAQDNIVAIKAGVGQSSGNHLHATFLHVQERGNDLGNFQANDRRNIIYGLSGGFQILNRHLQVSGSLMQSRLSTGNLSLQSKIWENTDSVANLKGIAWRLAVDLNLWEGKSRFHGHILRTPPTYYSLAAPMLIADRARYELRWMQRLWKNKIIASAYYRQDTDNLIPYKTTPTLVRTGGAQIGFYPSPKLPSFQLNYAPLYQQQYDIDNLDTREVFRGYWSFNSNYAYQIGQWSGATAIQVSYQAGQDTQVDLTDSSFMGSFDVKGVSVQQMLRIHAGWQFQCFGGYFLTSSHEFIQETISLDISTQVRIKQQTELRLGAQWLHEQRINDRNRKGIYLQGLLPLGKQFVADCRLERNLFNGYEQDYLKRQDYVARLGINYQW